MPKLSPKAILTFSQASKYLRVPEGSFYRYVTNKEPGLDNPIMEGNRRKFLRADLDTWKKTTKHKIFGTRAKKERAKYELIKFESAPPTTMEHALANITQRITELSMNIDRDTAERDRLMIAEEAIRQYK